MVNGSGDVMLDTGCRVLVARSWMLGAKKLNAESSKLKAQSE
jgi:hypothetical protein